MESINTKQGFRAKTAVDTLHTLEEKLRKYKKLYFVRFGDGEVVMMMGKDIKNYFDNNPDFKKELIESFTIFDDQYLIALSVNLIREKGMSRGVFAPYGNNDEMARFIIDNHLCIPSGVYESQVIFHYISVFKPKLMYRFFEEFIRPKNKMFIGNTPRDVAEKLYGPINCFIPIPAIRANETMDEWWPAVLQNIDNVDLVIPSAGVASNIIAKRLWKLDKQVHLLDIGSIIDAVEGKSTRAWIRLRGHKIQKVLPPEYREKALRKKLVFFLKDIKYFFRQFIKR